jgi:hypothetical protein
MTTVIPEVKEMVECAKRFLANETNIHELHGHAQQCKTAACLSSKESAVYSLADEWVTMTYRYWNEWGDAKNPLTEKEFKNWLSKQVELL